VRKGENGGGGERGGEAIGSKTLGMNTQHTTRVKLHEGKLGGGPWATGGVEEPSSGCRQQLDDDSPKKCPRIITINRVRRPGSLRVVTNWPLFFSKVNS